MALAEGLGMRPRVAHCHLGLGRLHGRTGDVVRAGEHMTTAATMYRKLDMGFWLVKAEAELPPPPQELALNRVELGPGSRAQWRCSEREALFMKSIGNKSLAQQAGTVVGSGDSDIIRLASPIRAYAPHDGYFGCAPTKDIARLRDHSDVDLPQVAA